MTSAVLSEALAPLRANPSKAAVLLDIDGTLAPIVEHAAEARVPEGTRQLLIAVAKRYGLVACISGRRASEARAMVSIGAISYLGSHGAELLRAGWTEARLDPGLEEWALRIRQFADAQDTGALRRHRVRLEDKGAILGVHWRGAPDEQAARALADEIAAAAQRAGLQTHWGRKVLEVRPPVRIDKGAGVRGLLQEGEIAMAVYVGDDTTDLDAFRAIVELRDAGELEVAVRVGVSSEDGPEEIVAEADVVVEGTDGVRGLLSMLID
ncbi:MAG TPA: trehalose-phosphatase [Solirubrobacteraceae bacterium]|nr:trehalose-phosphatase [Solirubrobacteraceae bacterium]